PSEPAPPTRTRRQARWPPPLLQCVSWSVSFRERVSAAPDLPASGPARRRRSSELDDVLAGRGVEIEGRAARERDLVVGQVAALHFLELHLEHLAARGLLGPRDDLVEADARFAHVER